MNKQVAIYVRVSTDDQAERGYSLPSQVEACQKFASQKGFEVVAVYKDDISGAKSIASRPEGGQLQSAIDSKQIKAVIVYQIDRLSRDIVDLLTTVRDWLRLGIEIYSLDLGQITSELDIVLVIKGWQGSDERQKIRERTMRGRDAKAKAGKAVGQGIAPYGYSYANGELFIDESEALVVRMIYDYYINGTESGEITGYPLIAKRLSEMGIPAPRGANWSLSAVYRILTVETYCGVLHYGRKVVRGNKIEDRSPEEHILIEVPAIVTRETWMLAQAKRTYNTKFSKRNGKRDYLLRGRIVCGCGCSMIGTDGVYLCRARMQNFVKPTQCKEPRIKNQLIESVAWDYVMTLITNPELFEEKLRQAQVKEFNNMRPKRKELEHVLALIEQTEKEADDVGRAMTKTHGLVGERLEQQAHEVDQRYHALTTRKLELQEALAFELTDQNIDNLLQFREAVVAGLRNPTFEDKRRWLEILRVGVTVTNRQAVIFCRLGREPFTFSVDNPGNAFDIHNSI
jgi:site-specific DNA recombinase